LLDFLSTKCGLESESIPDNMGEVFESEPSGDVLLEYIQRVLKIVRIGGRNVLLATCAGMFKCQ
jgi:hypothetical protein